MKSRLGGLRRQFMSNHLMTTKLEASRIKSEAKELNTIEWITLFRRNWEIYVDMVLQIKLRPFQMIMIHLMGISDVFFAICSRGLSKSFIVGLGAVVKMNLYPYSEVVITSSTLAQANKMCEDKIRDELIKKLSPYLLYMYEKEYIVITKSDDGYKIVNKLNGSILRVMPALDSSRGIRATLIIYEECRLLKKGIIDQVFRPMAHPRQAKYLENPLYANNPRWLEECQSVYITSARFKWEWFYKTFKSCVTGFYMDKNTKYNIFAGDIFMAIDNGLKTMGDLRKAKKMSSEMDHQMEDLNLMLSENEDCFFTLKSFKDNQIITDCWRLPSASELLVNGVDYYKLPKEENEIRMVVSDFAWTTTKSATNESDNSFAICMRGVWKNGRFVIYNDYMDLLPTADDADGCARQLKRLYWLYEADYLIPDARSGGEAIVLSLSKNDIDEEYGSFIPARGLGVSDMMQYQVAPADKLAYYRDRAVDKNYVPCVVPILGTAALNTAYWRATKQALERGNIKFLISMADKQSQLEDSGEYFSMTSEQFAEVVNPYGQTDMLINEAVNLKTEIKQDNIKLEAPRSGHRDRIVTLAMGVLIFSYIENEWLRQEQEDDYNIDDVQLVW